MVDNFRFNKVYGGVKYPCALYGTINSLVGSSSAGKTTMLTPLLTAATSCNQIEGWDICIEGDVYHINTEDAPELLNDSRGKILTKTDKKYHNRYHLYNITELDSPEKKYEEFLKVCNAAKDKSLIVLDVLTDVIQDINSISVSNEIIAQLSALAKKKNLIIVTCAHTNSGGAKATGYIGTRIVEKSTFSWRLELLNSVGITMCHPLKRKLGYAPTFGFYVDEQEGYKEIIFNPFPN